MPSEQPHLQKSQLIFLVNPKVREWDLNTKLIVKLTIILEKENLEGLILTLDAHTNRSLANVEFVKSYLLLL